MRLVQGMYATARNRVHVGEGYREEFEVKADVQKGSVSPLLFIIVLEALGSLGRTSMPMTLLSSLNPWRDVSEGS